jgi:protein-L-isoaspartate(D-aspartate) O-methyltransferase
MHASACESLLPFLHPSARVLDIGSGSGYLTHVLANLIAGTSDEDKIQPGGKVIGIDHIQPLVNLATNNMSKSKEGRTLLENGRVEFICGDGRKGYKEGGPYDAIHVGAAAQSFHSELLDQLKSPGRMFIPVEEQSGYGGQWIWVVDKDKEGNIKKEKTMGVRYVPLTDAPR